MRRLSATCFACWLALSAQAQQVPPAQAEFAVLRTDRVVVSTGESTHLNCSVVGTGDAAQMNCESHTSGSGEPLVYHVALLVGSDKVGYIVSCGGPVVVEGPGNGSRGDRIKQSLVNLTGGGMPEVQKQLEQHHQQRVAEAQRIACHALSAGQVVKGSVESGNLHISVGSETKTYRIETSAYIGPLTKGSSPDASSVSEPGVKLAAQKEASGSSSSSAGQPDQLNTPANTARVMVSSEPTGGDIYVDGNFMGNTPSQIELPAGSHTVRVEAKGQKPWSRTVSLTAGSKVTIKAVLEIVP
ncbi:MAG: PEGA domain-containing protein [Terriglobales bacterium]